jgi:hypothetical protein
LNSTPGTHIVTRRIPGDRALSGAGTAALAACSATQHTPDRRPPAQHQFASSSDGGIRSDKLYADAANAADASNWPQLHT